MKPTTRPLAIRNMGVNLSRQHGFTLMELMIAVVVVGILAAVAIPSYQAQMRQGFRTDAIVEMQRILAAQERYFMANKIYAVDLDNLGFGAEPYQIERYDIRADLCSDPNDASLCIEITATATNSQVPDGNIIMNSLGRAVRDDGTEHPF